MHVIGSLTDAENTYIPDNEVGHPQLDNFARTYRREVELLTELHLKTSELGILAPVDHRRDDDDNENGNDDSDSFHPSDTDVRGIVAHR